MLAGLASTACARPQEAKGVREFEWRAPKALARRGGATVPIYDLDNPPVLAVSSSVGLSGRWSTGAPLRATRAERRGDRILVWAAVPDLATTWLEIGGGPRAVEVWPRLHELPEIAALPKEEVARQEALRSLLGETPATSRLGLAAQMELARSFQRQNQGPEARAAWLTFSEAADRAELPSYVTHGLRSAAYVAYFVERNFADMLPLLERAERLDAESHFEAGQVRTRLQRGLIAQELGRFREASEAYREGARIARLAGLDRDAAFHLKALGPLLQDQGLHDEALQMLEEVGPTFLSSKDPRDRVWYLNDLCWILVRGMASGTLPSDPDRVRQLGSAAIDAAQAIGLAEELASIHASLAWLELLLERRAAARAEVERARRAQGTAPGYVGGFLALLEARMELDEGRFAAAYQRAIELHARALTEAQGPTTDLAWRALEVAALAADHLGRHREAEQLYGRALFALEEISTRVGLLEARGPYFADRRSLLDNAVAHWLARGKTTQAFALTDRYLGSIYRSLDHAAHHERRGPEATAILLRLDELRARQLRLEAELELVLPAKRPLVEEELHGIKGEIVRLGGDLNLEAPPPAGLAADSPLRLAPDEVVVLYISDRPSARGFLAAPSGRGLRIEAIPGPDVPLRIDDTVKHLYVVAGDVTGALTLASGRTTSGAPLLAKVSISYLPYASALAEARPRAAPVGAPLIVVDPSGDLPEAHREGSALLQRFPGATLLAGPAAKRTRVLEALDGRSLFHFAGHGSLDGPWRAHLRLFGDRLEAIDVLTTRAKLGLVVLNGCETGVQTVLGPTQAVALPELWWVAGARAVLSTVRPVGDAEARRFIDAFYDAGGADQPTEAYRRVALMMMGNGDDAWQAFRVVGLR